MDKVVPVLLLVRELGIGGCERDVTKIAIGLKGSMFEPHVAAFHPKGLRTPELQAAGVPILHLPVTSFRSRSAFDGARLMRNYMRQHNIQVVHSYDVPLNLFATPVAKFSRIPAVITSQLSYRTLYRPATHQLLRVTDRFADCVVVNCNAMRRHLIQDEKVPAERVYLCYNGVDTSVFFPSPTPRRSKLGNPSIVIGAICALRREKRLDVLLDAYARVRNLQTGMKLLIIGSGPLLESLEKQAATLGISQDCIFRPSTNDVPPWMRAIDVFVLPSESEAFSNALLEAMACGCCPIGSRVGGTPELIEDGKRGFLFESADVADLADKLARVIANHELRKTFGQEAARFAREDLSIERAVGRTQKLYASLLTTGKVPD